MGPKSVMRNGREDVGPFYTDSAAYVFGDGRPWPNVNHGAGIDVSPAVRDYLGLGSLDLVDWRFVEQADVPAGPWSQYIALDPGRLTVLTLSPRLYYQKRIRKFSP